MISIIIPTKNEPLINELIQEINRWVKKKHEVIVVDKSDVPPKLKMGRLIRQKSDGLGNAFLEGTEHAKGDTVVLMDGDFSHNPKYIARLLEELEHADVVIGSRFVKGGKNLDESHRKVVSLVSRKFASAILGLQIEDSMSGFGAIKREVLERIKLNPLGYKILLEIIYKSKKLGYKISEVPIIFQKRREGKTKVGMSLAGIKEVMRIFVLTIELRFGLR